MKKIVLFIFASVLISCGKNERNVVVENGVPDALQENKSMRSSRGSQNLVEDLYQELVAGSADLQRLESGLEEFDPKETQDLFYRYNGKSIDYYQAAKGEAGSISDSVSKKIMLEYIEKSNIRYFTKSAELQKVTNLIGDKHNTIEDSHTILKIVLTMPIIEKYQNEQIPDRTAFDKTIKKQDSLIKAVRDRTPKYQTK